MSKLDGKTIALLGARKTEELSKIVHNLGGVPLVRPAQGTVFLDDSHLEEDVTRLMAGEYDWIILTTGVGTELLYKTAMKLEAGDRFKAALQSMNIAARGYKTVNMLKKLGLKPLVRDDDGSTAGLVRNLEGHLSGDEKVALQLHGDPAPLLVDWLDEQSVEHKEILPYEHIPPEEGTMQQLVEEILEGTIDSVVFTSAPQPRNLMEFVREQGVEDKIIDQFKSKVIALAVGKVTAQVIIDEGIERVIYPEDQRMGSAMVELVKYYQGIASR
ncbi:uroporphyrinogen-III synthase [Peribacillus muralis]|uniref:uroporphyrinogen-III synthase n=1 Tax=Peribacillus muralis TaxID=264697 RepID=UPI001F4E74A9|nr:uroporphyrinogen-III synthase [Peribacillus muralis]MCK1991911.1 uroporphyrinogen-III synthase [Peribacillus muralis]MCK2012469.1 uroporphyrinogen-III synthase [Peribacillus muralis]